MYTKPNGASKVRDVLYSNIYVLYIDYTYMCKPKTVALTFNGERETETEVL